MTVIGINIVGEILDLFIFFSANFMGGTAVMMFVRIYVLYNRQKIVLGIVIFLFLVQVCMHGWLLTRGEGTFCYSAMNSLFGINPTI